MLQRLSVAHRRCVKTAKYIAEIFHLPIVPLQSSIVIVLVILEEVEVAFQRQGHARLKTVPYGRGVRNPRSLAIARDGDVVTVDT